MSRSQDRASQTSVRFPEKEMTKPDLGSATHYVRFVEHEKEKAIQKKK